MLRNRKHKECPMACKKCNKNFASPLDLKDNQKYLQLTSICRDFSKSTFIKFYCPRQNASYVINFLISTKSLIC